MRAQVASGHTEPEAIERARNAWDEWLVSDLAETTGAKVYTAEEWELRRALKMEA